MIRAFYSASSGLVAQANKQDVIANNIANAQTPGFKRQRVATSSFAQELQNSMVTAMERERPAYPDSPASPVIASAESALDNSEGPIKSTGNVLDFAINGPGAFQVKSGQRTILTRAGNFRVDSAGELVTADGAKVLGDSGPIKMPEGKCEINQDGEITSNGSTVGKLKVVGAQKGKTTLMQGAIEGANVNVVREMVDMITNVRAFEANQKVIVSVDSTLDKLINSAGNIQ